MLLIVGLGNPGSKYSKTRHNVGFLVLDKLAEKLGLELKFNKKFNAALAEYTMTFEDQKKKVRMVLAKPQTFMNNSGEAVQKIARFYQIRPSNVWVVHDDLDVELGTLRIRLNGSSAGQKGVQSIINHLGTNEFIRFRVGINSSIKDGRPAEDFVLEKFRANEQKQIEAKVDETVDILIESMDKGVIGHTI